MDSTAAAPNTAVAPARPGSRTWGQVPPLIPPSTGQVLPLPLVGKLLPLAGFATLEEVTGLNRQAVVRQPLAVCQLRTELCLVPKAAIELWPKQIKEDSCLLLSWPLEVWREGTVVLYQLELPRPAPHSLIGLKMLLYQGPSLRIRYLYMGKA